MRERRARQRHPPAAVCGGWLSVRARAAARSVAVRQGVQRSRVRANTRCDLADGGQILAVPGFGTAGAAGDGRRRGSSRSLFSGLAARPGRPRRKREHAGIDIRGAGALRGPLCLRWGWRRRWWRPAVWTGPSTALRAWSLHLVGDPATVPYVSEGAASRRGPRRPDGLPKNYKSRERRGQQQAK